jgi:Protein of unknown function (DUF3606)
VQDGAAWRATSSDYGKCPARGSGFVRLAGRGGRGNCLSGSPPPFILYLALQEKTMREDTEIRIPQDDERIDVTDLKEVDYWTQWFGVSEERLRTAVASAGTVKDDLRVYLGLP